MATSDKFRAKREANKEQVAPRREESAQEKVKALDSLFAGFGTAPPSGATPTPNVIKSAPKTQQPSSGQVEIYSTFGGGSILVNGKTEKLPYIVPDNLTLMKLRHSYSIDSTNGILRTRRYG